MKSLVLVTTIITLIAWVRHACGSACREKGRKRMASLEGRERAIVNQTNIATVSKANTGKNFWRKVWSAYGLSRWGNITWN